MSPLLARWHAKAVTRLWRWAQVLGPSGWFGMAAWLTAIVLAALAIAQQHRTAEVVIPPPQALAVDVPTDAKSAERTAPTGLSSATSVPLVIARMQAACRSAGLAWPQAEYRHFEASQEQLPQLEVQTVVKGAYPQVKAWVESLLREQPALGLRSWSMERPNSDTGVAEAKMVWVLYLQEHGGSP